MVSLVHVFPIVSMIIHRSQRPPSSAVYLAGLLYSLSKQQLLLSKMALRTISNYFSSILPLDRLSSRDPGGRELGSFLGGGPLMVMMRRDVSDRKNEYGIFSSLSMAASRLDTYHLKVSLLGLKQERR